MPDKQPQGKPPACVLSGTFSSDVRRGQQPVSKISPSSTGSNAHADASPSADLQKALQVLELLGVSSDEGKCALEATVDHHTSDTARL